jgi:flagellar motor switch protein FliN/FliY
MLSQEEIDALLSGAAFETPVPIAQPTQSSAPAVRAKPAAAPKPAGGKVSLDMGELKTLGERLKEGLGAAAEVSSTLLGRNMNLAPISIDMEDDDGLAALIAAPFAVFDFRFAGSAVSGPAALVISTGDAAMLADLMMGGAGAPAGEELDDLHETAVKEAIGPLLNGLAGAIGRHVNADVSIQDLGSRQDGTMPLAGHGKRVFAQYTFDLEGLRSGSLNLVIDAATARAIAGLKAAPPVATASAAPAKGGGVSVQPVQFPTLTSALSDGQVRNIEILKDVPMQVTVELGRTTMMIRDVLELGTGSIIELDKLAGEPVDLLVNNKLIARGEVVVIDESFGVRITDIVSPVERLKN